MSIVQSFPGSHAQVPLLKRFVLPVIQGPCAGLWLTPRGPKWRDDREMREQFETLRRKIRPGDTVIDAGAGDGQFTFMAARLVGQQGHVCALEPDPKRAELVHYQLRVNQLPWASVFNKSVSGPAEIKHGYADTTIDELVEALDLEPHHIRLAFSTDILSALKNAQQTLLKHRPTVLLRTGGQESHHKCCKFLAELGYQLRPLVGSNVSNAKQLICTPVHANPKQVA